MQVVRTYGDFSLNSLIGGNAGGGAGTAAGEDAGGAADPSRQNKMNKQAEEEAEEPFRMILVLQKQDVGAAKS